MDNDGSPEPEGGSSDQAQHDSYHSVGKQMPVRPCDGGSNEGQLAHEMARVQDDDGQKDAERA